MSLLSQNTGTLYGIFSPLTLVTFVIMNLMNARSDGTAENIVTGNAKLNAAEEQMYR